MIHNSETKHVSNGVGKQVRDSHTIKGVGTHTRIGEQVK